MIDSLSILEAHLEHLEKEHIRMQYSDSLYATGGKWDAALKEINKIKQQIEDIKNGNA